VWCVFPRSRASSRSGEETWPMSSGTSPLRPSTLLSRTSTRRSSLMALTSAPSSGGTSLVTWPQVVLLVLHPSALCTPSTLQEPVWPLMSARLVQEESSLAWVTAWQRSSSLMVSKDCTRASTFLCRVSSFTELPTSASMTQPRVSPR